MLDPDPLNAKLIISAEWMSKTIMLLSVWVPGGGSVHHTVNDDMGHMYTLKR